jgi:hypothetical protein
MSELSLPRCDECGQVEYACTCEDEGICCTCGGKLTEEEIEADRDQCFECYCVEQD